MAWQRWITVGIVLGLLLLLFALLMPAAYQAREAPAGRTTKNNLRQIGSALHNFTRQRETAARRDHPRRRYRNAGLDDDDSPLS